MALLDDVKRELVAVEGELPRARKAQVATMVRFKGQLHHPQPENPAFAVMRIGVRDLAAAEWLLENIRDLYDYEPKVGTVTARAGDKPVAVHVLVIMRGAIGFALQTGFMDARHKLTLGLPPDIVNGDIAQIKAAWRGAILVAGRLSDPGKASLLEVDCPSLEVAMALVGFTTRLGIQAKVNNSQDGARHSVVLRDPDAIERMLILLGAEHSAREWAGKRSDGDNRGKTNRPPSLDDANRQRTAKAASEACLKVQHAFDVYKANGLEVPEALLIAGQLRLKYTEDSLDRLGRRLDPPMTKDAIAGRLRRLLSKAAEIERTGTPVA